MRADKTFCMLQDAGFSMAFKPIRVKFKPSAKDVQICEESGVDLAQAVHKAMKVQERQAGSSQVKTGMSFSAMLPFPSPSCSLSCLQLASADHESCRRVTSSQTM